MTWTIHCYVAYCVFMLFYTFLWVTIAAIKLFVFCLTKTKMLLSCYRINTFQYKLWTVFWCNNQETVHFSNKMLCHISLLVPWIHVRWENMPHTNFHWRPRLSSIFSGTYDIHSWEFGWHGPKPGPLKKHKKNRAVGNIIIISFLLRYKWQGKYRGKSNCLLPGAGTSWRCVLIAVKTDGEC